MKKKSILLGLVLFSMTQVAFAQKDLAKVGISSIIYHDGFSSFSLVGGVDASYEIGLGRIFSLDLNFSMHYGEHESDNDAIQLLGFKQQDFLMGATAEVRYHFKRRYLEKYMGFGIDNKVLTAKYFFEPTENDPVPTYQGLEVNLVFSYGMYIPFQETLINPYILLGINPADFNEYPIHLKVGFNYVFIKSRKGVMDYNKK